MDREHQLDLLGGLSLSFFFTFCEKAHSDLGSLPSVSYSFSAFIREEIAQQPLFHNTLICIRFWFWEVSRDPNTLCSGILKACLLLAIGSREDTRLQRRDLLFTYGPFLAAAVYKL